MSYMESDSSYVSDSVSESIGNLKLRLRTVKEDCERYRNLEEKTNACFEDHRREIILLRQKERALSDVEVDRLQALIDQTRKEVEELREKAEQNKKEKESLLREELHAVREEGALRRSQLETVLTNLRQQWQSSSEEAWEAHKQEEGLTQLLLEELQSQEQLHSELQEAKAARVEQEALEAATAYASSVPSRRRRLCQRQFLPAGLVEAEDPNTPATHNAAAMVATVTRRNYYRPRDYLRRHRLDVCYTNSPFRSRGVEGDRRSPPRTQPAPLVASSPAASSSPRNPSQSLREASRLLLEELARLKEDYYQYKSDLTNPQYNSVETSQKMRECLRLIDRKTSQARLLRRQDSQYGYAPNISDLLRDIVKENRYCEAVYTDLLGVLRG